MGFRAKGLKGLRFGNIATLGCRTFGAVEPWAAPKVDTVNLPSTLDTNLPLGSTVLGFRV